MSAINKWFDNEGERFLVEAETPLSYICRSEEDNKLWVFSIEEVRSILERNK